MGYLDTQGAFDASINRGVLRHRSARLDALVAAIAAYIKAPSPRGLADVDSKLNDWKRQDPKEFADRGMTVESQLRYEIGVKGVAFWGTGVPRLVDPTSNPSYEPQRWNDNSVVQFSTNCYAYACNDPMNHPAFGKPQPGQLANAQATQMEDWAVRYAVMQDDRTRNAQQLQRLVPLVRLVGEAVPDAANLPGYYLIALVTAPNTDYHWLRQDRTGMWSHKPGWSLATDRDSVGKLIFDPREAILRIDTGVAVVPYHFTTFYFAPKGGVRTGALGTLRARRATL
jgi:hypothetical protein